MLAYNTGNGLIEIGGKTTSMYGVCSTASNVSAKTVTLESFSSLKTGTTVKVKFTYSNTAVNPTLQINDTGAKSILRYGSTVPGTDEYTSWKEGSIISLTYDGTDWVMNDPSEGGVVYTEITYAQWLAMTPEQQAADDYFISDYPGSSVSAVEIPYDNASSGLTANNVQYAIDEVSSEFDSVKNPMMFKGDIGNGGTITTLPGPTQENKGFVYRVITDGIYALQAAKVGDLFISTGSTWVLIPSGKDDNTTYTFSNGTNGFTVKPSNGSEQTVTVTPSIADVSASGAGLAPKGASVSSQTQSTRFLREDGSWAAPSYTQDTNTTYTFANGTNGFTVTPSGGSAKTVTVTPSIANASTATAGLMSAADKIYINGLPNTISSAINAKVPNVASPSGEKYLCDDNTWQSAMPPIKYDNIGTSGNYDCKWYHNKYGFVTMIYIWGINNRWDLNQEITVCSLDDIVPLGFAEMVPSIGVYDSSLPLTSDNIAYFYYNDIDRQVKVYCEKEMKNGWAYFMLIDSSDF